MRSRRPFVRLRTHACSLAAGRARGCAPPEGVAPGFAFASGSAATATLINMFAAGDHILSVSDVYGGTNRYFNRVAVPIGFEVTMVDMSNLDNVKKAFKANTKNVKLLLEVQQKRSEQKPVSSISSVLYVAAIGSVLLGAVALVAIGFVTAVRYLFFTAAN